MRHFGDANLEVQVITEGPQASTLTVMRDSPRWGVSNNCFTTDNREVANQGQIFDSFKSRVVTQADVDFLVRTKGEAKAAINAYDRAAQEANEAWAELASEYATIASECAAGTRSYDRSGTGIAIALFPTGLTGAKADCVISETGKLQMTKRVAAVGKLDELIRKREIAFKFCDLLMVNALRRTDAQEICRAKKEAFERNKKVLDSIAEANKKMDDIRSKAFEELVRSVSEMQAFFERLLQLFRALIEAIKALLEIVAGLVIEGAKLAARLSGFFLEHPNALLIAGGLVGLGVLAFVARPYISILGSVVGRNKSKRKRKHR